MLVAGAALVAVAIGLVVVGRWEARHAEASAQRGIDRVRAAVGPQLAAPTLTGVANVQALSCLLYAAGSYIYAYELCFDGDGRLIDAVDATGDAPTIASLRPFPAAARVQISLVQLSAVQAYLDRREGIRSLAVFVTQGWANCVTAVRAAVSAPADRTARRATHLRAAAVLCRSWVPGMREAARLAAGRLRAPAEARVVDPVVAALRQMGDAAVASERAFAADASAAAALAAIRAAVGAGDSSVRRARAALEAKALSIRGA